MKVDSLVSVIIPMYNSEDYICATLKSVLFQTFTELEIIVVDDCSTDSSYTLVSKIVEEDTRVQLFKLDKNSGGPAKPRNFGIHKSTGNYIAFLDSDDLWEKNKIELQLRCMNDNGYNFTSTNQKNINKQGDILAKKSYLTKIKDFLIKKNDISDLIIFKHIALSSVLIKKDSFILKFDESSEMIAVEDYFLWLNLLNCTDIKYFYIDRCLINYRVLDNSISCRDEKNKHEVKSLFATLKFIILTSRYDLYFSVLKSIALSLILKSKNLL